MSAPPFFPTLPGLTWGIHKKPIFSTVVASHVSGREVRTALYQNPIWEFEVAFEGLDSTATGAYPPLGAQSLQTLIGFFLSRQGQYETFLFSDPTDSVVTVGAIGMGDGSTATFTLSRYMGAFFEPVGWVTSVSNVYLNGVNQSSGWSLSTPNSLVFTTAPSSGVAIAATFTYAFQCRFSDDSQDFEQFMSNLWKADGVKFRSVRTS
jgi:uncharacterized protein (TIGR02217 family)